LNAGAWVRRDRLVIVSPVPRHTRRSQAETPLIELSEFGRPPLFWARGYFVSTVGRDEEMIRNYIRNQEEEDNRLEQMNLWR
jgi:REP element-mobilizing transposase RayT